MMGLYVRIYTDALTDEKLLSASPGAVVLWVRGLLAAKSQLTDGEIKPGMLALIGAGLTDVESLKRELVKCGLWTEANGRLGVSPQKWARYQTTRKEVEQQRADTRARVKKFRQKTKTQSAEIQRSIDTGKNALQGGCVTALPEIPLMLNTPAFVKAWSDWLAHRKEIKKPLSSLAASKQFPALIQMGAERAVAAINHSIASRYQGIFEPHQNGKHQPPKRPTAPVGTVDNY